MDCESVVWNQSSIRSLLTRNSLEHRQVFQQSFKNTSWYLEYLKCSILIMHLYLNIRRRLAVGFVRISLLQPYKWITGNSDNPVPPFPQQCNQLIQFVSVAGCENCPSWFAAHRRGSTFAYQAHCPSPKQCLCTVSQNCSHHISFPHVVSPSWVSIPLLVRNKMEKLVFLRD